MCDFDYYDVERVQAWLETYRKARKQHTCDSCGAPINPGDRYKLLKCLNEGEWDTEKGCGACDAVLQDFGNSHNFFPYLSTLHEFLVECVEDSDEDEESDGKWKKAIVEIEARARAAKSPRWAAYFESVDA